MKYQNFGNFRLPISTNILEFGTLIDQYKNKTLIQLKTGNVFSIKQVNNENFIEIYRKGELVLEFRDTILSENSFIRSISDKRFYYENNTLIKTEIIVGNKNIKIFDTNTPLSQLYYYDSILMRKIYQNIIKLLENSWIFQNKKAELFILLSFFILLFVIFPENNTNLAFVSLTNKNIIKLVRTSQMNNWKIESFFVGNKLFTKELFESKFNLFWNNISPELDSDNHMFVLFKIKYKGSEYTTIGNLQRLNINDKNWYFNWIINNMIYKSDYYNETPIESFIFSYGFKNGKAEEKEIFPENISTQLYKNNKLPISNNPLDYGKLILKNKFENYSHFILQTKEKSIFNIKTFEKYNEISLIIDGDTILNFKDEIISDNKFIRIIKNKFFYFIDNKEILFIKEYKSKFISKTMKTKNLTNNFLTLDIETFMKNNVLIPCCISIYDGETKSSFVLNNFKDSEELIITALKSIMVRKYNGYNVYIHNFAKFDAIFLLKYLVKLGIVNPIIHNNRLISLNLNFGPKNCYKLAFKDSYLILLASLAKLGKGFGVETQKSRFLKGL